MVVKVLAAALGAALVVTAINDDPVMWLIDRIGYSCEGRPWFPEW